MRPEKQAIIGQISKDIEDADYVIFADYSGLSVEKITNLRSILRPLNTRVGVAKNRYIKRSLGEFGADEGISSFLKGPTAVISGRGEVTEVARVLAKFRKENDLLSMKGGRVEDDVMSADDMAMMAAIPPRPIMLGKFVGTVAAPLVQLVGVFNQKVSSLLYVLKAIEEKKNKE